MKLMIASEFGSTAALETFWFQALSLGNGTKPFKLAPWPVEMTLQALFCDPPPPPVPPPLPPPDCDPPDETPLQPASISESSTVRRNTFSLESLVPKRKIPTNHCRRIWHRYKGQSVQLRYEFGTCTHDCRPGKSHPVLLNSSNFRIPSS